jgi:hypothetical protein
MIAFDLVCSNGHKFECWFRESASFDKQKAAGIINCPVCNDGDVEKAFSPFSIKRKEEKEIKQNKEKSKERKIHPLEALRLVQEYIDKHFEDVGSSFAKEALKMHYGETEKRNIRGVASPDQETLLKEEGVTFVKIPIIKRLDS